MNTRKRWFSLVLCLVLCLGLLPGTVWAETKDRGTPEKCFADNQFNFPEEASTNMASNNNFCEENDSRAQCGSCYVEDPYESSRVESQDNLNFAMLLSSDDNIMIHKGIDVSAHQGTIDWDKVATQIEFAILRCGYGRDRTSQDDKYWAVNVAACQRLGIPFGVYLYSYAESDEQAASEAEHVLRLLEGVHPNLPVYLDLEDEETVGTLSNADILRHATTFCNAMLERGYTPGVYANKYWWTTHLTDSAYDQWSRWIAQVGVSQPTYNKSYDIWQYSFKGSVSGITGDVDLDYYYGALEPPHPVPPEVEYNFSSSKISGSSLPTAASQPADKGSSYYGNLRIKSGTVNVAELYITPPNGSETCFERTPASGTGSYTQYIYTDNKYTFSQSGTYQYRWHISYAGNTKSVDYSGVFQIESDTVKLNINGYLDGKETGSLEGYGTADVYINGSQVASNVNDYYGNVPIGATYEVKNIVYAQGYLYHGVKSGALTGTVGTSEAKILLNFRKNIDIGTNFYARIISKAQNMALTNTDDRDVVGQMVDASDAQIWYFERQSDGFYKIRSAKDERYLDVYSVSNVAESNVHVHDDGDYSSMLWAVHTTSESGVYLFGVKSTESLLDINGATKNIHVYPDIDANTQLFTIQKLGNLMVTLNPCDGNVSPTSISVTYGEPYGNLPTPTLTGYTFAGWYTAESGGTQVMPSTKVTTAGNHTLYAHWTLDYVSVTGITLSKTAFTLTAGDSETLISTVTPDNATNKDVTWTTSDTSVATVSNGKVTAVGAGSATITVTTVDGGKTATCNVTVQQDTPASDAMLVSIENKTAAAGKTVDLAIKIENNPGIAMTQFKVTYDAALTLESADVGDVFSQSELTPGAVGNNPYTIMFYNTSANRTDDGTLAVLHFRVSDTAEEDSAHSVSISGIASGIDENKVPIDFVDGSVTIRSIVFGDVNGDGDVNGLDVLRLGKYLTGWDVSVDEAAADVNVDGEINGLDQLRLAKYCAGWPVTLGN